MVICAPNIKQDFSDLNITIQGTTLTRIGSDLMEQSIKFVGIHLDEHLTWKNHVNHINSKISRALFAIKQAQKYLPPESLKSLYFALIQPHLIYGILAWGKANKTIINKTEIL